MDYKVKHLKFDKFGRIILLNWPNYCPLDLSVFHIKVLKYFI